MRHPVKFTTFYDLVFDYRGISHDPSGVGLNCPGQARVIWTNAMTDGDTPEMGALAAEAAEKGQDYLEEFVREHFFGVGRLEKRGPF